MLSFLIPYSQITDMNRTLC